MMLNYLTPHGKWHIHSTYGDNQRMTTLSRGVDPLVDQRQDAESLGVEDNDWVEVFNDHGVSSRGPSSVADPAGHLHAIPLAGTNARRAQVAAAKEPPRRWPQQPDTRPAEAELHDRRLRTVHLPLQLLGTDRLQPRHAHHGPQVSGK